jgi:hypothetical protein
LLWLARWPIHWWRSSVSSFVGSVWPCRRWWLVGSVARWLFRWLWRCDRSIASGVSFWSLVLFPSSIVGADGSQFSLMAVLMPHGLVLFKSVVGLVSCWRWWALTTGLLIMYAKHSTLIGYGVKYMINNELVTLSNRCV